MMFYILQRYIFLVYLKSIFSLFFSVFSAKEIKSQKEINYICVLSEKIMMTAP